MPALSLVEGASSRGDETLHDNSLTQKIFLGASRMSRSVRYQESAGHIPQGISTALLLHGKVKHGKEESVMGIQKLSRKNQIVIPKAAREAMRVKGGDKLLVVVKGDVTVVMPEPKSYAKALRGLAKGMYPQDYLDRERQSW